MESHFAEVEQRLLSQVSILHYKCLACRVPRLPTSSERSRLQVDDWVTTHYIAHLQEVTYILPLNQRTWRHRHKSLMRVRVSMST